MFNALKCAKNLEEVGIPRAQAEAHVQMISEIIEMNLASKQDLQELKTELKQDFAKDMVMLEQRLTIKLGTIVSLAIGIAVALSRLVH